MRDIVGAGRVLAGKAPDASGVVARGNTLVVRLTRPAPDFPHRTASTFFCAVPPALPIDPEGAGAIPAAGPYHVVEYRRGEQVVLRRNQYYGGRRPHHVDGFDVDLRASSPQEVLQRVDRGEADWGHTLAGIYFDPALSLVEKYGLNRSQLFLRPGLTLRMLGFNSSRPLFKDNPSLRRAVNFALNRRAIVNVAGPNVSRPSDQYLPSILPGFRDADVYPLERSNVQRAKALANGNLRGGTAVLYVNSTPLPMAIGQLIKKQLGEIGLEVEVRGIPIHSASAAYFKKLATGGEPWDLAFGLWTPATSIRSPTSTSSSKDGSSGERTSRAFPRGTTEHAQRRPSAAGNRQKRCLRNARCPTRTKSAPGRRSTSSTSRPWSRNASGASCSGPCSI